jgi:hypothetical protein
MSNETKIFQHPKQNNTVVNTSKGKIETKTDAIGRKGTFTTSDPVIIDLLTAAKWKELPVVNEEEVKAARKSVIPEGTYMFQSTEYFDKKINTSAGAVEFDKNGLAKVDAKTATVLLAAGYTPTDETKLKLVKAGVIKIETKESLNLLALNSKKPQTKTDERQPAATGLVTGTDEKFQPPIQERIKNLPPDQKQKLDEIADAAGKAAHDQAIQAGKNEDEADNAANTAVLVATETFFADLGYTPASLEELVLNLSAENKKEFNKVISDAGFPAYTKAKKSGKTEDEAKAIADKAAEKAGREFIANLKPTQPDPLEALNEDQLLEICKERKIELPENKTKKSMIKAINAAGVKK